MKKTLLLTLTGILASLVMFASSANAADLGSAKQAGLIGEQANGYLGLVQGNAPADVKALVNSVNAQRKAKFSEIAAKNGISPTEAAKVFAKEAADRTTAGNFIQNASGQWVKK